MYLGGLDSAPKLDCGHDSYENYFISDSYENGGHKQSVPESGAVNPRSIWSSGPSPHTQAGIARSVERSHPQILLYQIETRCLGGEDTGYRDPDTLGARP